MCPLTGFGKACVFTKLINWGKFGRNILIRHNQLEIRWIFEKYGYKGTHKIYTYLKCLIKNKHINDLDVCKSKSLSPSTGQK